MTLSDPIANMLTIFRNANSRGYKNVSFPFSKIKLEICRKMKENAFINDY
jgi:ribosomal protein S8